MIPPEAYDIIAMCEWGSGKWLFFSENVFSPLIYYSHLTPVIVSIAFGAYIYFANRKSLLNKSLLFVSILLSFWLLLDLILWATDSLRVVVFVWAIVNMLEPTIYVGFLYLVYVFILGRDVSMRTKLIMTAPLLPTILTAATSWNIAGFNLTNCDREVVEGPMAFYNYIIEIFYTLWIFGLGVWSWFRREQKKQRIQVSLVVLTTLVLLLGFASGNIVGSFSEDWAIGQYGLFVIPVTIGTLAFLIVQFRHLATSQLMTAQMLVIGLLIATGSVLFIQEIVIAHIIVGITLVLLAALGFLLLRSFAHELEQRKKIEALARDLERSNQQQIILIHFITHQIKGFLTKSRNIFSMALDGDFGPLPDTLRPMVEEGFKSDTKGVNTIQEILTAANIKSGKVTYEHTAVDLKAVIEEVSKDLKLAAEAKGLTFTLDLDPITIQGDKLQLTNALKNLIDNSIKYTLTGSVTVSLKKEGEKVRFKVKDTGVGITAEDMGKLFTEGGHGTNSQKVNVESTGFGLYIVKNIIEAHHGKVWAESEGEGKGSRFIAELPA